MDVTQHGEDWFSFLEFRVLHSDNLYLPKLGNYLYYAVTPNFVLAELGCDNIYSSPLYYVSQYFQTVTDRSHIDNSAAVIQIKLL